MQVRLIHLFVTAMRDLLADNKGIRRLAATTTAAACGAKNGKRGRARDGNTDTSARTGETAKNCAVVIGLGGGFVAITFLLLLSGHTVGARHCCNQHKRSKNFALHDLHSENQSFERLHQTAFRRNETVYLLPPAPGEAMIMPN
ncbi:hypothetical protein [Pacificoceanicola onchidii]|uniref:hypothetical protein n=1 Tax=Pacificoceanicola onchidii TaxID=2562685 RepID=UPI001455EF00|nr:hypothetical protein [Pacificoceanicola onchidii]